MVVVVVVVGVLDINTTPGYTTQLCSALDCGNRPLRGWKRGSRVFKWLRNLWKSPNIINLFQHFCQPISSSKNPQPL